MLGKRKPRPGGRLPSFGHAADRGGPRGRRRADTGAAPTHARSLRLPHAARRARRTLKRAAWSRFSKMRLLITRPRIQYDSTAVYEPLDVEYKSEDLLVSELKNMIYKRQLMLSTGEDRKLPKEDSPVALEPHDQILLIRKFRDAHMQGVLLEDHRSLKFYGLIDKVESNLFLARTNPLKNEIAELLLIDGHSLTPHQKKRMQEACATQDKHYYRHCMQM